MSIFALFDITRKPTTRTDLCAAAHAGGRGEAPPARYKNRPAHDRSVFMYDGHAVNLW